MIPRKIGIVYRHNSSLKYFSFLVDVFYNSSHYLFIRLNLLFSLVSHNYHLDRPIYMEFTTEAFNIARYFEKDKTNNYKNYYL